MSKIFQTLSFAVIASFLIGSGDTSFAAEHNVFMKEIKLYSKKYPNNVALVDDEDFDMLNTRKWYVAKPAHTCYAVAWVKGKMKKMHRVILGMTDPKVFVDHKDGNGLNNQRENIRVATYSQNMANRRSQKNSTSKYLGVYWSKPARKWKAQVRDGGALIYLGYFEKETDAAIAYNNGAVKAHGEFANLNKV